uniref:O-methyltransferase C-terminal domain-containing protein n=1 Tax=Nelumbo nucifera TaxID=4432 RepID=A0A822Y011_NELNU|nr:TPA_asm: hypothetical protein HUJ06_026093 [Nelumbo nucifera]
MLNFITSKYPQIKGINFDLPHIVADAPSYPGVEHVAGDMFENFVLHDWSDEQCLKILKNCWKALPNSGKIIVVEYILPEARAAGISVLPEVVDLIMLSQCPRGKERTYEEFEALAMSSRFSSCERL